MKIKNQIQFLLIKMPKNVLMIIFMEKMQTRSQCQVLQSQTIKITERIQIINYGRTHISMQKFMQILMNFAFEPI